MAVCISSHAHTGWKCWNIGRSEMIRGSTAWKSSQEFSIFLVRWRVSCLRVAPPSMVAGCCTTHRRIIPPIIVAHLSSWAVCLQSSALRQGAFPGWNARIRLEREEQPQHLECIRIAVESLRRSCLTVGGDTAASRSLMKAAPWKGCTAASSSMLLLGTRRRNVGWRSYRPAGIIVVDLAGKKFQGALCGLCVAAIPRTTTLIRLAERFLSRRFFLFWRFIRLR